MGTVANVVDGKLDIPETSMETERKVGSELGKEEFLQLLVTQMKYQDPLEPADNTEYVSQLAQFSELEQMQNLNSTTTNTSAFTLVGRQVRIAVDSGVNGVSEVQGTVDYVTIQNGKAYVSVEGTLYSYDDVIEVIDEFYLVQQWLPGVKEQSVTYRHFDEQDVIVKGIELGSHGYEATSFAAVIIDSNGESHAISPEHLSYNKGTLTISKEAFKGFDAGSYQIAFVFNDAAQTVVTGKVALEVKGIRPPSEDDDDKKDQDGTGSGDGTGSADGTGSTGGTGSTDGTGSADGTGSTGGTGSAD
ncbi:MAG: hypothetical protein J1E62_06725 [Lachnospiraceae bacterium]|nr:hypothetical protein [Lachnospiraceae bacterium]